MMQPTTSTTQPCHLTRRAFVKQAGLGAAAIAASALLADAQPVAANSDPIPAEDDPAVGVMIDLTRCSGCQSCALACKVANRMPEPETVPTKLDSSALSFVDTRANASGEAVFVKRQCMNCVHPACASACTVGALRKTAEGPVVYDSSKCIGCRYCQYACPFGVPAYEWDNVFGLISKCQMCFQRVADGQQPACVAACPNGALHFGKRQALVAQAHALIASSPDRYLDHVYGEHEVGGTSMLYLSAIPFTSLGFPALGDASVSRYAETVMQMTPAVAVTVASLATGIHLLLRRRQRVAEFTFQHEQAKDNADATSQRPDHRAPE